MYIYRSQRSKTHPAYLRARVTGWDPKALENELLSSSRDANEIDRPNDELILVNTFVNSQHLIKSIPRIPLSFEDHRPRTIRWLDGSDGKTRGHVRMISLHGSIRYARLGLMSFC